MKIVQIKKSISVLFGFFLIASNAYSKDIDRCVEVVSTLTSGNVGNERSYDVAWSRDGGKTFYYNNKMSFISYSNSPDETSFVWKWYLSNPNDPSDILHLFQMKFLGVDVNTKECSFTDGNETLMILVDLGKIWISYKVGGGYFIEVAVLTPL